MFFRFSIVKKNTKFLRFLSFLYIMKQILAFLNLILFQQIFI